MSTLDLSQLQTSSRPIGHLPVLRGILDALGIPEVVNEHLPRHSLVPVSDADCVAAMVLNILSGRVALWRMDEWLGQLDAELVLGEGVDASAFHDSRSRG